VAGDELGCADASFGEASHALSHDRPRDRRSVAVCTYLWCLCGGARRDVGATGDWTGTRISPWIYARACICDHTGHARQYRPPASALVFGSRNTLPAVSVQCRVSGRTARLHRHTVARKKLSQQFVIIPSSCTSRLISEIDFENWFRFAPERFAKRRVRRTVGRVMHTTIVSRFAVRLDCAVRLDTTGTDLHTSVVA
jgi:hypothetical protein